MILPLISHVVPYSDQHMGRVRESYLCCQIKHEQTSQNITLQPVEYSDLDISTLLFTKIISSVFIVAIIAIHAKEYLH